MNLQSRSAFLTCSGVFLLGMLIINEILSWLTGIQPLSSISWSVNDVLTGLIVAMAMLVCGLFFTTARDQAEKVMGAALANCRWYDLVILASLVGLIEELLFRGVLEPWVARYNPWVAFVGVSLFFGLLHAVSVTYAVIATLLGATLSLLAHGPGEYNLLRPIIAHAVYDLIAFLWLAQLHRQRARAG